MKAILRGAAASVALLLALLLAWPADGEEAPPTAKLPSDLWVMFWNVENLHAPGIESPDEHVHRPSKAHHAEKMRRLREVIRRVNWGRGPDLIALAEVESKPLVEDLLAGLPGPGYRVHLRPGASPRRINTAIAIRKTLPEGEEVRWLDLAVPETDPLRPTGRLVTHAKLPLGHTSLDLFVCHLKSKWDLGAATEETRLDETLRRREAEMIRAAAVAAGADANVIVTGDFNEDYRDDLFRTEFLARAWHRGDPRPEAGDADARLLNLGGALHQSFPGGGTHYYEPVQSRYGRSYFAPNWSILDSFLISEPMSQPGGLYVTPYDAYIGVSWDLLNALGTPGKLRRPHESKPFHATGVSDHLPVLLRVRVHQPR